MDKPQVVLQQSSDGTVLFWCGPAHRSDVSLAIGAADTMNELVAAISDRYDVHVDNNDAPLDGETRFDDGGDSRKV